MKRIYLSAALLLGGVMLAATAAYLLVGDATLVAWIAKRAGSAAGVDIRYDPRVKLSRTLSPTLRVGDLAIGDPETGYRVQTSSLEVQISLPRLLLGQLDIARLWLGDTRVELSSAGASTEKALAPTPDRQPALPVLHDVRIGTLRVVSEEKELRVPTLKIDELALAFQAETDTLVLTAQIDMADDSVAIEAAVPAFQEGLNARNVGFSASARSAVANLVAKGQLDFGTSELIVSGDLWAQASDLRRIPTGIKGLKAPGTLTAQAQFAGTMDRLALSNIRVQWQGPEQSGLEIKGGIDDLDDFAGVALDVSGQLGESPWVAGILPDSVGVLKHVELSGRVSGTGRQLQVRELRLAARDANGLDVSLRGRSDLAITEGHAEPRNMDLELVFKAPETRAARALLFEEIPEFGALRGRADIHSASGPPSLENIVVSARDPAGIDVDLNGRIGEFPLDPVKPNRGYDLDVRMHATQLALLGKRLNLKLPLDGPADASYRIEGDTQALRVERIEATAGKRNTLQLSAEGQVHFRDWNAPDPLQMMNLGLQATSRDTRSLANLLGNELPKLGALSARARLQTVSNRHQIIDFRLQTAKGAPVALSVSGAANHVVLLPELGLQDIALNASAETADASRLNALFGWQDAIPAIGPAKATAKLFGNDRKVSVSDVSITAGKPDILLIKANGRLGTLSGRNDWRPQDPDLNIKASATGSKDLAEVLGYLVPELGPLAASAKFRAKGKTLGLESGQIRIGDADSPVLKAEGFVRDLFGARKTRWEVALDLDGHRFAGKRKRSDLGALRGTVQISNADGTLGIDRLRVKSTGSELLRLDIAGRYGDFGKPESLSLTGMLKARDLQIVGALLDQDWPAVGPVRIDTRITRSEKHTAFDTTMTADKIELDANLVAVLDAEPPRLSGTIKARNAFLPQMAARTAEDVREKRASKGYFFSREPIPFDWLQALDLDLSVDIESFDPELARGESAQARIVLKSGRLSVAPAIIKYPKGQLELDLRLDAQAQARPSIHLQAYGRDLDPWRSLYMEKAKKELDADLDVDIDLSLSGESAHELAASAQGNLFLQLKNGTIRRDLVDLLFVDVIGWALGKTTRAKRYDLDCGVADYRVDQGVVTTKAFLLDARHIAASGEGTIDLGKEEVNYVFLPRKKSRIVGKADPVKVTGALVNPKVEVIPWKAAAATYGTLYFAPYIFVGVTALDFLGDAFKKKGKESPCLEYEKRRAASAHSASPSPRD